MALPADARHGDGDGDAPHVVTPAALGFVADGDGWGKTIGGRTLTFRRLRARADFAQVERLQRAIFGVADRDLVSASMLVVMPKTGGDVLGAFDGETLVGFLTAYGGYVERRPRLVSDMLGVDVGWRGGLGFALKALQAALALDAGYREVVWTVDPLRAANDRLNFERLGAHAEHYLEDLYGPDFGTALYGGLPTDRLLVTWPLDAPRVVGCLLGTTTPRPIGALDGLPDYPAPGHGQARLAIPADIHALLATDPQAARDWRFRLRAALQEAFGRGYAIIGFAGGDGATSYLLLDYKERVG